LALNLTGLFFLKSKNVVPRRPLLGGVVQKFFHKTKTKVVEDT